MHAHPIMPSLIGLGPRAACKVLQARGIPVRVAPFDHRCARVSPSGRVVRQSPPPGRLFARYALLSTEIQSACGGGGGGGRRCHAKNLALSAQGRRSEAAGTVGDTEVEARIVNRGPRGCYLDRELSISVQRASGLVDPRTRGNPESVWLHWGLAPNRALAIEWDWSGACRPSTREVIVARLATRTATTFTKTPCSTSKPARSALYGAWVWTYRTQAR
jgi:hypothetical protein